MKSVGCCKEDGRGATFSTTSSDFQGGISEPFENRRKLLASGTRRRHYGWQERTARERGNSRDGPVLPNEARLRGRCGRDCGCRHCGGRHPRSVPLRPSHRPRALASPPRIEISKAAFRREGGLFSTPWTSQEGRRYRRSPAAEGLARDVMLAGDLTRGGTSHGEQGGGR